MTDNAHAIVKRAVDHTRSHAVKQALGGLVLTPVLVLLNPRLPWWVIVFIVLNSWVLFVMGRRWLRLRKTGRALVETPDAIAEIRGWPLKLPPGRMPMMIEVRAKDGGMCSLLLDHKKPNETVALVQALHAHAPAATMNVPNVEPPKPTNESSPEA